MRNTANNIGRRSFLKTAAGVVVPAYFGLQAAGCATRNQFEESPGIYNGDNRIILNDYVKNFYVSEFGGVNPNPTPEQVKQAYLRHGFMEYPTELNQKANIMWKDRKVLESILTRGGWALAVVNDAVEFPLAAIGGFVGGIFGKKGKKDTKKFVRYFADSTIGGEGYNMIVNELVRLNGKGMIDVAYNRETTKAGGLGKLVIAGGSTALAIILPFAKHGHHHSGGAGAGSTPPSPF